ncbi:hypothetical protein LOK49_LG15G01969 [Camellia lanceoleosa]|uniref:Uncharacterized protein n=1 Tax=Camellia lanceoleosa TaxID=1840588 RepID=A0ACC0F1I0_9ERIC|nr:hypothetical protein LOK49_LG15G01969 [Camellia lanceoleosa]
MRGVSKFTTVALVDTDSKDIQVYVKYFDITLIPSKCSFQETVVWQYYLSLPFLFGGPRVHISMPFTCYSGVQITPSGLVHFMKNKTSLMMWRYATTDFLIHNCHVVILVTSDHERKADSELSFAPGANTKVPIAIYRYVKTESLVSRVNR